jgi:hypothetical protein
LDPFSGSPVIAMPFSSLGVFRPPAALSILHHKLFSKLPAELLGAKATVIVLLLKTGIAAVCFLKIDLKILSF